MTTSNQSSIQRLHDQIRSVIRGKDKEIELLIIAVLSNGAVLLRDVPGVGKTTLAKTLAASVDPEFQRVQCTPDLLPADINGGRQSLRTNSRKMKRLSSVCWERVTPRGSCEQLMISNRQPLKDLSS